MFTNLRQVQQGEITSDEVKKQAEYNKKIETFNRNLYGSELISLANFIADYEQRANIGSDDASLNQYDPITLKVTLRTRMVEVTTAGGYQTRNTPYTNYQDFLNDFTTLENRVNTEKNRRLPLGGRTTATVEKIAGLRDSEITQMIQQAGGTTTAEALRNQTQLYSDLKLELTNFKNRRFRIVNVRYSPDNNRIVSLEYEEIPA